MKERIQAEKELIALYQRIAAIEKALGASDPAMQAFYEECRRAENRLRRRRVLEIDPTAYDDPPLPLPESFGGPAVPFADAVDAYQAHHRIPRTEVWRRVSPLTGNSPRALDRRYRHNGGAVWRFGPL